MQAVYLSIVVISLYGITGTCIHCFVCNSTYNSSIQYPPGTSDSSACVGPSINDSYLQQCNAVETHCHTSTSVDNTESGNITNIQRSCALPETSNRVRCSYFPRIACSTYCNTNSCNDLTAEAVRSTFLPSVIRTLSCYVCTYNTSMGYNDCEGPIIPSRYLQACPFSYCVTSNTSIAPGYYQLTRGCMEVTEPNRCFDFSGSNVCNEYCTSDGCNSGKVISNVTFSARQCYQCTYDTRNQSGNSTCVGPIDNMHLQSCRPYESYCVKINRSYEINGVDHLYTYRGCQSQFMASSCSSSVDAMLGEVNICTSVCTADGCNVDETSTGAMNSFNLYTFLSSSFAVLLLSRS